MSVGGSIESVGIDGRVFSVPSDTEVNRKLGGFENEVRSNGDSSTRVIKTRVPSMLDGLVVAIDDTRQDQEFLQERANSLQMLRVDITYTSGVVYQDQMQITGDLQFTNENTAATLTLTGTRLTQQ